MYDYLLLLSLYMIEYIGLTVTIISFLGILLAFFEYRKKNLSLYKSIIKTFILFIFLGGSLFFLVLELVKIEGSPVLAMFVDLLLVMILSVILKLKYKLNWHLVLIISLAPLIPYGIWNSFYR